jgi:hypothetical protein
LELEVSISLFEAIDADDPSFSTMLLCGFIHRRPLFLFGFTFACPSYFFMVCLFFELALLQHRPSFNAN